MTGDSVPSNIATATSPTEPVYAPDAPVLNSVAFLDPKSLVATLDLTMPTTDTNGDALTALTNIKVFFDASPDNLPLVAPAEFPGSYPAGSAQTVTVTVQAWATAYAFEAEVSD
jgi:hypothetical protein